MKHFLMFSTIFCLIVLNPPTGFGQKISTEEFELYEYAPEKLDKSLLLEIINEVRTSGCICGKKKMPPVGKLKWNDRLELAALSHASDMHTNKYFSHTGLDGSEPWERAQRNNYISSYSGENILLGSENEIEAIDGWLESPPHCKNIMDPGFKDVAVAADGPAWVQMFGTVYAETDDVFERKISPFKAWKQKRAQKKKYKEHLKRKYSF